MVESEAMLTFTWLLVPFVHWATQSYAVHHYIYKGRTLKVLESTKNEERPLWLENAAICRYNNLCQYNLMPRLTESRFLFWTIYHRRSFQMMYPYLSDQQAICTVASRQKTLNLGIPSAIMRFFGLGNFSSVSIGLSSVLSSPVYSPVLGVIHFITPTSILISSFPSRECYLGEQSPATLTFRMATLPWKHTFVAYRGRRYMRIGKGSG